MKDKRGDRSDRKTRTKT